METSISAAHKITWLKQIHHHNRRAVWWRVAKVGGISVECPCRGGSIVSLRQPKAARMGESRNYRRQRQKVQQRRYVAAGLAIQLSDVSGGDNHVERWRMVDRVGQLG